jgi:hypothetical protein
MPTKEELQTAVRLLAGVTGGELDAELAGTHLFTLDGDRRNVDVELASLSGGKDAAFPFVHEGRVRVWQSLGVARTLARTGWRFTVRKGAVELVAMGRDVSAVTGHVRVNLRSLGELRKLRSP